MNEKITKVIKGVMNGVSKNSPAILTGIGIAGMLTSTVLAVKATPKAIQILEEKYGDNNGHPIHKKDIVKSCWKCYIPAAVSASVSIACLVGSNSVNAKRNAALATAYKIAETSLVEYKDKVVETIGEKKEKVISEKVAQDKLDKDPVDYKNIIITGNGSVLCYDPLSSRYFESDMESIRAAVNNLNANLISQDYVSLNEFYDELDLEHTSIGDDIGWNIGTDGLVDVKFSSTVAKGGKPCLVMDYRIEPRYNFSKLI